MKRSIEGTNRRRWWLSVLIAALTLLAPLGSIAAAAQSTGDSSSEDSSSEEGDCPSEDERNDAASAIVVGKVIDVRTGGVSTSGNESGDDSIIVEVIGIDKGGAQNPLAVFYPGEELPQIGAESELNIVLTYSLDNARAESSLTCGYTVYANGDSIDVGSGSNGTLGETAGETLTQAVRTAGLAGAAVLAVTMIWRVFREFRPRLT